MVTDLSVVDTTIQVYRKEEFAARAAATIAGEIRRIVAERDHCSLALAGGTTPQPVYAELAGIEGIPWHEVDIYFGDERAVGPTHAQSNYASARRFLFQRAPISDENVHRMHGERPNLVEAARAYEGQLPDPVDLLLLGVGVDGHVASIFPLSRALDAGDVRVCVVQTPVSREQRLTITPSVICEARCVIVLARGRRKATVVQRAVRSDLPVERCPARLAAGRTWILDDEAARRIEIPFPTTGHA